MPMDRIDLHVHTTASDGTETPTEVVQQAALLGLRAIAITDHDTMDGVREALAAGARAGSRTTWSGRWKTPRGRTART